MILRLHLRECHARAGQILELALKLEIHRFAFASCSLGSEKRPRFVGEPTREAAAYRPEVDELDPVYERPVEDRERHLAFRKPRRTQVVEQPVLLEIRGEWIRGKLV